MFSSENNHSSYPWFYHHQSPSFTNAMIPESNNSTYIIPIQPSFSPIIPENPTIKLPSEPSIQQQNSVLNPSKMVNCVTSYSKRAPGKKDRHTKISTAQGVRDRRVRLSMSIARDFFNLQDMLGFDKASKTLGWLMAESKLAIDELTVASNKQKEDNKVIEDTINEDVVEGKISFDANSLSNKKKNRRESNLNGRNASMETKRREEARNRARERTRNKKSVCDRNNIQLHQQRSSSAQQDWMVCQSSSATITPSNSPYGIVSKGVSSKDDQESCNYNNDYFNKSSSESCNYGGFPALNIINLSTEIHINAKTWEAYNNQLLH